MREHDALPDSVTEAATREATATSPAPTDVVVVLQRSLGNQAVSRLLSRQDEGEPTGPTTGPTRIDRDDPLIQTVRGPILEPYGRYRWLVRYQLPFPVDSEGWLIQDLYQESHTGAGIHFWEAWRVRRGDQYPADASDEDGITYDDRYVHGRGGATPDQAGWHRHTGVIRFYPGPLPSEFGPEDGSHFRKADTRPAGWTGQGMRHDAYAEWRPGLNGFVAYAGTRELRVGDHVTFRPRTGGPTRLETEPESVPQPL